MKICLFALSLLFAAGCGSKTPDPQPQAKAPAAPTATYTGPGGVAVAVSSATAYSVTAAPNLPGQMRRAIGVVAQLGNGHTLVLSYEYLGGTFPNQPGAVTLDAEIRAIYHLNLVTISETMAPRTAGTLFVDSVTPQVVSGTYTGPLTPGGPAVSFTFSRLPI